MVAPKAANANFFNSASSDPIHSAERWSEASISRARPLFKHGGAQPE